MAQQTTTANSILERIRERGYWHVVIHPGHFEQERIADITRMYSFLQERAVRFRGWYFPHLEDNRDVRTGLDWIEEESEDRYRLEYWRFYQSGQFVDYAGFFEDWGAFGPDSNRRPGQRLLIANTVYRFTEIFEFAARLALSDAYSPDNQVRVAIHLKGLQGRCLSQDETGVFWQWQSQPATIDEFPYALDLPRVELITTAHTLAIQAAEKLFHRFQWRPAPGVLQNIQAELLQP